MALSSIMTGALLSANTSRQMAHVQSAVKSRMDGHAGVLDSEIKLDSARGGDTKKKQEELDELQKKASELAETTINTLTTANEDLKKAAKEDQEVQRAEKAALASYFKQQGMSEEEVSQAIAAYKAQQAASKPDASKITKERDDALAELAALKNSNALRSKGVREEDLDYVMFKIGALMKEDDKLDFDKAATKYLKDNPRFTASGGGSYRVKTGTDSSGQGGSSGQQGNDSINNAIRKAIRRTY